MKTKLTITVEKEVVPPAKAVAEARGTSLSHMVENFLRELASTRQASFSERWRGKLSLDDRKRDEPRYRALVEKHRL